MAELWQRTTGSAQNHPVNDENPLFTRPGRDTIWRAGGATVTRRLKIPGIGAGAAYADGDAFGTLIQLPGVFRAGAWSGAIVGAFLLDLDDEGVQVDVPLFVQPFTPTADNSAFAPSDADLLNLRGVLSIDTFTNWSNNQFGRSSGSPWWVSGTSTSLWTQLVIRGAATIAAGAEPSLGLVVVPD
jgi:hypothetical protein